MKKVYIEPEMKVVKIDIADIIATSDIYGDPTVTNDDMQ